MNESQTKQDFIDPTFPSAGSGIKVGVPDYPRAIGEAMR